MNANAIDGVKRPFDETSETQETSQGGAWIYWAVAWGLVAATTVISVVVYNKLPERVPIHWDIHGKIDAYGPKSWAVFGPLAIMAVMPPMFAILPWLSPPKYKIDSFQQPYLYIMVVIVAMMGYIQIVTSTAALAPKLDTVRWMICGMMLFFAMMGNMLGKIRRNYFMGIRTPWTLASERVWNDTHRFGARMFVLCGGLGFVMSAFGANPLFAVALILIAALGPVLYSFTLSKKLEREGVLAADGD